MAMGERSENVRRHPKVVQNCIYLLEKMCRKEIPYQGQRFAKLSARARNAVNSLLQQASF